MAKSARIRCPICNKENEFFAEPVGPFCSPRCKLIDLGKWLGEEYRMSEPLRPDHFAGDDEGLGQTGGVGHTGGLGQTGHRDGQEADLDREGY